jgi:hypothetical protein
VNNETTTPAISDNSDELPDCSLPSPEQAILGAIESSARIEAHEASSDNDLLSSLRASRVLFYPGAGEDITPALRFAALGIIDTIVYCDYLVTQGDGAPCVDEILQKFEIASQDMHEELRELPGNTNSEVYQLQMQQTVTAHDLGQTCRGDFFPKTGCRFGIRDDDSQNPLIGAMGLFEEMSDGKILREKGGRSFTLTASGPHWWSPFSLNMARLGPQLAMSRLAPGRVTRQSRRKGRDI